MLIPEENVKDLAEIPDNVKQGLDIIPVKWIDRVLELALERYPSPLLATAAAPVVAEAAPSEPAKPKTRAKASRATKPGTAQAGASGLAH